MKKVLLGIFILAFILILIGIFIPVVPMPSGKAYEQRCRSEIKAINTALQVYKDTFGEYPSGNNKEIIYWLTGHNERKIIFIDVFNHLTPKGEMLDPWGIPFLIQCEKDTIIQIKSAGKNKKFGDADDISREK